MKKEYVILIIVVALIIAKFTIWMPEEKNIKQKIIIIDSKKEDLKR